MSLETFKKYYEVKDEMYAVLKDEQFEQRSYPQVYYFKILDQIIVLVRI